MNILNKIKDVRSSWKEVKQERYIFMNQTENRRLSMKYAQMYKTKKINEKAVLYESYWGRGMIDNPYALFVELYGRDEFKDFTHIWYWMILKIIRLCWISIRMIKGYDLYYLAVMNM